MCPSGVSLDSSEVPTACVTLCLQGNSVGCREIKRFSGRYQYVSQIYLYKMQCMMQGQNQSMSLAREQALSLRGRTCSHIRLIRRLAVIALSSSAAASSGASSLDNDDGKGCP